MPSTTCILIDQTAAFKRVYSDAKLIAPKEVEDKNSAIGLVLDGAWETDPPSVKYGFTDDVRAARMTLIEADLLLNLPTTEQYSKTHSSWKSLLAEYLNSHSAIHKRVMKRDVRTVASWNLEWIIPCHGDIIEKDAGEVWWEAYRWYLD
ncbi:hypothetical protein WOLCODRAFT_154794 [Wolfiporia cocos MD-104 SS10]|uniref:Uncharacterized protein n=1 Tax=Wolfiporia cocos (strain MD-104) TaxID=742152 RepID=A0A2H3JRH1_WOLCO|nr:hypothetical protein WOLCODRAFT_154794 [Wolfiporia cocos MD-104 SS10]